MIMSSSFITIIAIVYAYALRQDQRFLGMHQTDGIACSQAVQRYHGEILLVNMHGSSRYLQATTQSTSKSTNGTREVEPRSLKLVFNSTQYALDARYGQERFETQQECTQRQRGSYCKSVQGRKMDFSDKPELLKKQPQREVYIKQCMKIMYAQANFGEFNHEQCMPGELCTREKRSGAFAASRGENSTIIIDIHDNVNLTRINLRWHTYVLFSERKSRFNVFKLKVQLCDAMKHALGKIDWLGYQKVRKQIKTQQVQGWKIEQHQRRVFKDKDSGEDITKNSFSQLQDIFTISLILILLRQITQTLISCCISSNKSKTEFNNNKINNKRTKQSANKYINVILYTFLLQYISLNYFDAYGQRSDYYIRDDIGSDTNDCQTNYCKTLDASNLVSKFGGSGNVVHVTLNSDTILTKILLVKSQSEFWGADVTRTIKVSGGAYLNIHSNISIHYVKFHDLQTSSSDPGFMILCDMEPSLGPSLYLKECKIGRESTAQYYYRSLVKVDRGCVTWDSGTEMDGYKFYNCDMFRFNGGSFCFGWHAQNVGTTEGMTFVNSRFIGGAADGKQELISYVFKKCTNTVTEGNSKTDGSVIGLKMYGGTLDLQDCQFQQCTCSQPGNGGAISLVQQGSAKIFISNVQFTGCKTLNGNGLYGWGGAIYIDTEVTASLTTSNFHLTGLTFSGCQSVINAGHNIDIKSTDTATTGNQISTNLIQVSGTSIVTDAQKLNYMGICRQDDYGGYNIPLCHCFLFVECQIHLYYLDKYYVSGNVERVDKFCGYQDSPCQTIKCITEFTASEHENYNQATSSVNIILLTDTSIEDTITIHPSKYIGVKITIQSNGQPNTKYLISTSDKTNSLFTISEASKLELSGLCFNNLKPSDNQITQPLIKITTATPELSIINCKFERSSNAQLYHSLFEMNGGKITISSTNFNYYQFLNGKSLMSINSNQVTTVILSGTSFNTISQTGSGNGAAINAVISGASKLTIQNACSFSSCTSTQSGGAIYTSLSSISITSGFSIEGSGKTTFSSCKASTTSGYGGAIYLYLASGTEKKYSLSQASYTSCDAQIGKSLYIYDLGDIQQAVPVGDGSIIGAGSTENTNLNNLMGYDSAKAFNVPLYYVYT
ncbi:MAG: hypothetical protein EZS28_017563, partial [Streblomastix strix]